MILSETIRRLSRECAASHPELDPWGWAWANTEKWDMANANWPDLDAREPDLARVRAAIDASDAGNFSTAIQIWSELAERGSVRSLIELGICSEYGLGTSRDLVQAENWYKRAADDGSQYAMLRCARFAASREDFAECQGILQPGVDDRWPSALFWQAWYRIKQSRSDASYRSTFPLLKEAAKSGHPAAQAVLANYMVRGKFGVLRAPFGLVRAVKLAFANNARQHPTEETGTVT